jgi:hypothetical protein
MKTPDTTPKHTPGPWIAEGSQILQGGYLKDWKLVIASLPSRADPVAKLDSAAKNYSERNANARLIAEAPELLKIAIAYRNLLQASATTDSDVATFQHIESTIARATA